MNALAVLLTAAWINIGPGGGGWIQSVSASRHDAERLWVGSDVAGVFRSENGGRRYVACNEGLENLFVETIAEHPTKPEVILVGTKGGVYKSSDGGRTWALKRSGFPPVAKNACTVLISKIVWDAKGGVYATVGAPRYSSGGRGEVYYSADEGESWTMIVAPGQFDAKLVFLDAALVGGDLLVSTPTNGLFRSSDGGRTWKPSNTGLPEHLRLRRFGQSRKNPKRLYLTLRGKAGETPWAAGVMRSDDGGRSWRRCGTKGLETVIGKAGTSDLNCSWYDCVAVEQDNPDVVYLAGGSWWCKGIWRSTDGGLSWTKVFAPKDNQGWLKSWNGATTALSVSPLPPYAITFGTSSCVYRSVDRGETWDQRYTLDNGDGTSRSCGLEVTCLHAVHPSTHVRGRYYFSYYDVGLLRADGYGKSFRPLMDGIPKYADCFSVVEHPDDPNRLWAAFGGWSSDWGWIGESSDGGMTWRLHDAEGNGWVKATPRHLVRVGGMSSFTLACTASRKYLRLSDDFGRSWRQLDETAFPDATRVSALASDGETLYAGTAFGRERPGALWASDDLGKTWRQVGEGTVFGTVTSLSAKGDLILMTTRFGWNKAYGKGAGGAWTSTDRGKTWRLVYASDFCTGLQASGDTLVLSMTDHPYHDRCRGEGVMMSRDFGKTWLSLNDPSLANRNVECLVLDPFNPETVLVGTGGNSAFILYGMEDR